jgi:condensin complex subunit 1
MHTDVTLCGPREISTRNFTAQDPKGPRSFSRFLLKLTETTPRVVLKQISLLLGQLDSESYPMRVAIVEIIGLLITNLALAEGGDAAITKKQIESFWDLLMRRFLDTSTYVRAKVIQTIIKLLELPVKFIQQRPLVTELAIRHLDDKSAIVRRYAVALISKLVSTHPFGLIHGGDLNLALWEERHRVVKTELEAMEARELASLPEGFDDNDSDQDEDEDEAGEDDNDRGEEDEAEENGEDEATEGSVVGTPKPKKVKKVKAKQEPKPERPPHDPNAPPVNQNALLALRFAKNYHDEALALVRAVEGAIPKLNELLNSTGRAEVLEAMDFFRIAHEYKFESATVGIKTMLHLIWVKDNSAVVADDGKELKGIRSRVIECYKELYFEAVVDLTPKQQVSRIARNMIESVQTLSRPLSLLSLSLTLVSILPD